MKITLAQLQLCMPYAGDRAPIFLDALNGAMEEFHLDTLARQTAFLAQVCHESGSLKYTLELADGHDYEGRQDLGNTHIGDGKRYRGRGLIQITGRANTEKCLTALGRPLDDIAFLETPLGASRSAGWFWFTKGCNEVSDAGRYGTLTKIINGGYNGLDERITNYIRCRKALGL